MLTEGLLMYLPRQAVGALAAESAAQSGIQQWIFDLSSPELMRRAHGDMMHEIEKARAEDHLERQRGSGYGGSEHVDDRATPQLHSRCVCDCARAHYEAGEFERRAARPSGA